MPDMQFRQTPLLDYEIRNTPKGRTVCGLCVPFDQPAKVPDRTYGVVNEVFRNGSFSKTISEFGHKVKFLSMHEMRTLPLGKAIELREDAAGLYGEFMVSNTRAGDEVLTLINDGVLDSFSVGFVPIKSRMNKQTNVLERTEVALKEVSVVAFPAYEGAAILAVREEVTETFDPDSEECAPNLVVARQRLADLR